MAIDGLEARVRSRMPLDARVGTRVRAAEVRDGHEIEVIYRIDRKGQRRISYFCDGARMSRATLLMLLCPEAACPQAQAVQLRWRLFIGEPQRRAPERVMPLRPAPLMVEVPVDGAGHHCMARPASFECLTRCPMDAHAPAVLHKTGWDVFEQGTWIAGGLRDERDGTCRPRFESLADVRQWLAMNQANASALLNRYR